MKKTQLKVNQQPDCALPLSSDITSMKMPKDIRYRGFLSYRGLRLLALILMTCSQFGSIMLLASRFYDLFSIQYLTPGEYIVVETLAKFGQSSFALLLIASIGMILSRQESFKRMLINYFVMAVITYLMTVFFVAQVIENAIAGLPTRLPFIEKYLEDLNLTQSIKEMLTRLITSVIPGDGTIHMDQLNRILAVFGYKSTLPDIQNMLSFIPKSIADPEKIDAAVAMLASMDLSAIIPETVDSLFQMISQIPNEYYEGIIYTKLVPTLLNLAGSKMNINIYWNLFQFTLFYFFISYQPKKLSPGKKMIFHCFSILPAGWLIISFMVSNRLQSISGFQLPVWFVALLNNVRPASIVLVFLLVAFQKYNELEHANDPDYRQNSGAYLRTRRISLHFSTFAAISMIVISGADKLLGMIPILSGWGFGKVTNLWMAAPILLLYSFTKKPKHKVFNAVIPVYYCCHYTLVIFGGIFVVLSLLLVFSGNPMYRLYS